MDDGYGPFPPRVDFSKLDARAGIKIRGQSAGDMTGVSVSGVGDVSGDGLDDLCFTASGTSSKAFCVYGWSNRTSQNASLQLSSLQASRGLRIVGASSEGMFRSVASAGDVNGDGRRDVILGAPYSRNVYNAQTGAELMRLSSHQSASFQRASVHLRDTSLAHLNLAVSGSSQA